LFLVAAYLTLTVSHQLEVGMLKSRVTGVVKVVHQVKGGPEMINEQGDTRDDDNQGFAMNSDGYDQSKQHFWTSDDDEFDDICHESKKKRGTTCDKQVKRRLERVITNTKKPNMNKQGNTTAENVKASDTNSNGSLKNNDDLWTSEDEDFPKVVKPGDIQVKKKECSIHSSDSDNSSMDSIEFEQQRKTFSRAEKLKWNNGEEEWKPRDDGKDYESRR